MPITQEKGAIFGRPQVKLPANFNEIANMIVSHIISINDDCKILKMSKGTLYKYLKINLNYIPRKYKKSKKVSYKNSLILSIFRILYWNNSIIINGFKLIDNHFILAIFFME